MSEQKLLNIAFRNHKAHGAIIGMNFVECRQCKFHVHSQHIPPADGYLVKHWNTADSFDPIPITDPTDPRLAARN